MGSIMSTPMHQMSQSNQQNPNDVVNEILTFVNNGGNPEQELKNRLSQNPQLAQEFGKYMQQNRNRNPWELFYELAAQRGINPAQFGLPRR